MGAESHTYPIRLQSAESGIVSLSSAYIALAVRALLQSSHCNFLMMWTLVKRRAATTVVVRAAQNAVVMILYGWRVKASLGWGTKPGGGFIAGD